jgi:hypothetical protein
MTDNAKIAALILKEYGDMMSNKERDDLYESAGDLKKVAQYTYQLGAPFNQREVELLSRVVGNMNLDNNFERDGDLWSDDILNKYAEFVHNYQYQYNDNAHDVDPDIDTEEVHVGPMAQELEKVDPSLVNVDAKSGYKTVNTDKLEVLNDQALEELKRKDPEAAARYTLYSAGAIADLARKVENTSV